MANSNASDRIGARGRATSKSNSVWRRSEEKMRRPWIPQNDDELQRLAPGKLAALDILMEHIEREDYGPVLDKLNEIFDLVMALGYSPGQFPDIDRDERIAGTKLTR